MDHGNLVFAVLAIWQFTEGVLKPVDDELEVVDSKPVWSTDGQLILYERTYYGQEIQALRGLVIHDLVDKSNKDLRFTTDYITYISRSPRMDLVSVQLHDEIYIIDFNGNYKKIGQGEKPTWGADGISVIYRTLDGTQNISFVIEGATIQTVSGGGSYAVGLYISSIFYFIYGG
jgi:hypothetical protein